MLDSNRKAISDVTVHSHYCSRRRRSRRQQHRHRVALLRVYRIFFSAALVLSCVALFHRYIGEFYRICLDGV